MTTLLQSWFLNSGASPDPGTCVVQSPCVDPSSYADRKLGVERESAADRGPGSVMDSHADRNRSGILTAVAVLTLALVSLGGCSDDFAGQEMRLGSEDKVRPLGVILDPPEVAPGETVQITLHWYDPRPAATQTDWRVALEYDPGFYGVDPVERNFVDLPTAADGPATTTDQGDGFFTQTFSYTVPANTIVQSPSMVSLENDDAIGEVADALAPMVDPTPAGWNDFLAALEPGDLDTMDAESQAIVRTMADLFAARIRFRATLTHGATVEVTRDLTVRYSSALGSGNTNQNPRIEGWSLVGIPAADVLWRDRGEHEGQLEWTSLASGDQVRNEVTIEAESGWTYYLVCESAPESYTSPFTPGQQLEELLTYKWFRFRADDASSDEPFFVRDDGEEADSFDLDEAVRIEPVVGEDSTRYRVCLVVRDERPEWQRYQATPGQRLVFTDIVFRP